MTPQSDTPDRAMQNAQLALSLGLLVPVLLILGFAVETAPGGREMIFAMVALAFFLPLLGLRALLATRPAAGIVFAAVAVAPAAALATGSAWVAALCAAVAALAAAVYYRLRPAASAPLPPPQSSGGPVDNTNAGSSHGA